MRLCAIACFFAGSAAGGLSTFGFVSGQEFQQPNFLPDQRPQAQLVQTAPTLNDGFQLPPPQIVPMAPAATDPENRVQLQSSLDQVTLVTRDAPLSTVLSMIAQQQGQYCIQ